MNRDQLSVGHPEPGKHGKVLDVASEQVSVEADYRRCDREVGAFDGSMTRAPRSSQLASAFRHHSIEGMPRERRQECTGGRFFARSHANENLDPSHLTGVNRCFGPFTLENCAAFAA